MKGTILFYVFYSVVTSSVDFEGLITDIFGRDLGTNGCER